jgi:type VI secretion system protein ImpJ
MKPAKPLFWHQGLFLQPQHFQQNELYASTRIGPLLNYGHSWFWGVCSLAFDDQALADMTVTLSSGEFLFPDATWVSIPDNAIILSRKLDSAQIEPHKPFLVYVGVRHLVTSGANVSHDTAPELLNQSGTRFALDTADSTCPDLHDTGSAGEVPRLKYLLKLFFENEKENLGDYSLIPIARLEYNGERFIRYAEYAPPAITLAASPALMRICRAVADQMLAACRQLEQYKVPRDSLKGQGDPAYFIYMLGLMALNRYVPLLYHRLSSPACHPFEFYGLLREIIGELSSFTDRFGCLADQPDGTRLVQEYDHLDAARCFARASELIGGLIRMLITGPENTVVLARGEDGGFSASIPLSAFESAVSYYLLVRTGEMAERVVNGMRDLAKIGSRESVAELIARSIPGLPAQHLSVPPPGIPRRADTHCFVLDLQHEQWLAVQQNRSICVYWDSAPADAAFELVIMRS